jgi:hypothetical protein
MMRRQITIFLAVATPAFLADLLGVYPSPGTTPRFTLDLTVLLITAGLALVTWRRCAPDPISRRRFTITLAVSAAVALLTSTAFKFGLLVPLPSEGIVVRAMEAMYVTLRALGA